MIATTRRRDCARDHMPDIAPPPATGTSFEASIRRVLWILLGGMLVVAAGGVLSAWALADAARDVNTVEQATTALGGVLEGMIDQETGVRGFILTGQERFLETYGPGGANADSNRAVLGDLARKIGGLGGSTMFDDLDRSIGAWREIADEEIVLVRTGRPDAAIAIVESGAAKERFDLIRANIRDIDERLSELIDARNARQADLQRLLAIIGVVVLVGTLATIAATLRWLNRTVTRPLAMLTGAVGNPDDRPFSALTNDAAGEVAAIARSADRLRMAKDLERNEAVLVAEQTERSRLAADLHDGPVQMLFALQLRLQQLVKRHPQDGDVVNVVGGVIDGLGTTQSDLRSLMFDLAPPGLGERPLPDVIAATVPHVLDPPARAHIDVPDDMSLGTTSQLVICRAIVEAIRNVNHHAAASTVTVRVRPDGDVVEVDVSDDGVGFDVDGIGAAGHFGLGIMRSLVESVGGSFHVTSARGAGTTVHFVVPA